MSDAAERFFGAMPERDSRRPRYGCSDRSCGALDCSTCRGTAAALAAEDEEPEPIGMVAVLADIRKRFEAAA